MSKPPPDRVLESMGVGIIACDLAGALLTANPAAQALVGPSGVVGLLGADAALAWADGAFSTVTGAPLTRAELPLVIARGGRIAEEVMLLVRNEEAPEGRLVCGSGWPLCDAHGEVVGGVMALREPSGDRATLVEARKHRWFLESVVEHVPAMIFVKDAEELRFERFNRAGEALLGMRREVLLGKNDYDLFPRDQADFFTARDRETLAGGDVLDIAEEPIQTAHGVRWLHTRKVPVRDDSGRVAYLLGISEDITERKAAVAALSAARAELEERVRERTAELERANADLRMQIEERHKAEAALSKSEAQLRQAQKMEAVGRLAGGVAHDFNNMLTAILSFARIVQDEMAPDGQWQPELGQIITAAERAAILTKQLLAFSRQQVLQPVVLDVASIVRGMDAMLRRLIGEDVRLETVTAPNLGRVLADPGQLEQVVLNLVINARDAMPRGGRITIEAQNVELDATLIGSHGAIPSGPYVLLAVSDTGEGMSPVTLARIFEPFFTTKERGQGTGLGLSTCYGIIKQSGGDITVYSEAGRGSVFKIYLPRSLEAAGRGAGVVAPSPAPHAWSEAHAGDGRTVLLVEDEDVVRAVARRVLTDRGYHVLDARDAEDALAKQATFVGTIHLLLSDVIMPGMSGRELAEVMVALRPGIKVLMVSGYADSGIVNHGVLDPDVAFLAKPYTPDALRRKVREVLEG